MKIDFKDVNIIAYKTQDGVSRIEYKEHIVQTYGYIESGNPDIQIMHFIIDEHGNDIREETCLVGALLFIDKKVRNRDRKLVIK